MAAAPPRFCSPRRPDRRRHRRGRSHAGRDGADRPCAAHALAPGPRGLAPAHARRRAARRLSAGAQPLQVHALPGTIAALKAHIFNNLIWPDYFPPSPAPSDTHAFCAHCRGEVFAGVCKAVEVLPAVHTVPRWVLPPHAVGPLGVQRRHRAQPRLLATCQPVARGPVGDRDRLQRPRRSAGPTQPAPGARPARRRRPQIDPDRDTPSTSPTQARRNRPDHGRDPAFDDVPQAANHPRHDIRWLSAGQTFEL